MSATAQQMSLLVSAQEPTIVPMELTPEELELRRQRREQWRQANRERMPEISALTDVMKLLDPTLKVIWAEENGRVLGHRPDRMTEAYFDSK